MKFNRLRFGTAGIPISTPNHNTVNGVAYVRELGLENMELEFVHSVNVKADKAPAIKQTAKKHDVVLTAHGSYYINLASPEKDKVRASMQRILSAADILNKCGGHSVTFHAGFYQKESKEIVYEKIRKAMKEIVKQAQDNGINVWIRPETTGKATQWGDLKEILQLSQDVEQVMPCVDFSHLHARSGGKENTLQEFRAQLELMEKMKGRELLNDMHIHLSGINYTAKGERNHLILEESDMNYKDLLKAWKEFKIKGVVVCESPNIEEDALLLQKEWSSLCNSKL